MPYPRTTDGYPSEFQELFRRALENGSVQLTLPTPELAINLRHQLHAYRRAVENDKIPGWHELRELVVQISNSTLTIAKAETISAIRSALGARPEPSEQELTEYLKKLEDSNE